MSLADCENVILKIEIAGLSLAHYHLATKTNIWKLVFQKKKQIKSLFQNEINLNGVTFHGPNTAQPCQLLV